MSSEYRMTKLITPELISIDPQLFVSEATTRAIEEGRTPRGRLPEYSIEEKTRACILGTCLGSLSKTSHLTGINVNTLSHWKSQTAWWPAIREQVEQIRNELLAAKLTEVIEEATDQILDRVVNGDEVYDYTKGEVRRVPVPMKVLGDVGLRTALEKREELKGRGAHGTTKKELGEHLRKLAEAFESLSRVATEKVIEGEIIKDGN